MRFGALSLSILDAGNREAQLQLEMRRQTLRDAEGSEGPVGAAALAGRHCEDSGLMAGAESWHQAGRRHSRLHSGGASSSLAACAMASRRSMALWRKPSLAARTLVMEAPT